MTDSTVPAATAAPAYDPVPEVARELGLPAAAVKAALELFDEGATVPFIARYRKERTGGLDEVQLRAIEERRAYRVELEQRRAAIRDAIAAQGKLDEALAQAIAAADSKAALEDLYLPYKPKRQTRAQKARERGLEPLARRILEQPADGDPQAEAAAFVTGEVGSLTDALAGAKDIAAEVVAETAAVRATVRAGFAAGAVVSQGVADKIQEPTKYEPYYDYREPVATIPSHRFLAVRRGEAEGILRAHLEPDGGAAALVASIERLAGVDETSPWAALLREAVADAYQRLLAPSIENDVRGELKQRADVAAVDVFADNLTNLLLAAPFGGRPVLGIDPGLRTGCKCAAVDATGRYLASITVFLSQGEAQLEWARAELGAFIQQWNPAAIAVGNGTGGREAEGFVRKLLAALGIADKYVVSVNEAGASVYSASDLARSEFPDLDLTIRGAISIARRLQDPLAELVKVEPKAIGVGQYQHDVHQPLLARKLEAVVESCVNKVGVELNTASAQLLGYVAGIGKSLAGKIVVHRDQHGAFRSRQQLLDVSGLGPKAFEQAAGFLRVRGGEHPLDASAVHPERYAVVETMAADLGLEVGALIGNGAAIQTIDLTKYVGEGIGEPTLRDILDELGKPGRDPRAEFTPPAFRDDVTTMQDLKEGMVLEGVVTNVTAFGAFVDIGVHQDGLVHISRLSDKFVKDASELVKVGDRLTVKVIGVDLARRRIALTARKDEGPRGGRGPGGGRRDDRRGPGRPGTGQAAAAGGGGGGGGGPQGEGGRRRGPRRDDRRGPRPPQAPGEAAPMGAVTADGQAQGAPVDGAQAASGQGPGGERPRDQRPRGPRPEGGPGGDRGDRPRRQWRGGGPEQARADQPGGEAAGDPNQAQARGDQPGGDQPRNDQPRGDRGPRNDQPRGDRGPRGGGRGEPFRGDRRGGPGGPGGPGGDRRDDRRGPGGPGGRRDDRGPRDQGPRGEGPPARDDRGGGKEREGFGISGFKNSPFAKLGTLKPGR